MLTLGTMQKRFLGWLVLMALSLTLGMSLHRYLHWPPVPVVLRLLGLVGMLLAVALLRRSGRLLRILGEPREEWGITTRLVVTDLYTCLRHPHHLGIGLFVSSLFLAVGQWELFLAVSLALWTGILVFLYRVEEPELVAKFGDAYRAYRKQVPMLLGSPLCVLRYLFRPLPTGPTGKSSP